MTPSFREMLQRQSFVFAEFPPEWSHVVMAGFLSTFRRPELCDHCGVSFDGVCYVSFPTKSLAAPLTLCKRCDQLDFMNRPSRRS